MRSFDVFRMCVMYGDLYLWFKVYFPNGVCLLYFFLS